MRVLDAPPTLAAARRPAEDLQLMVEDMIKLLEAKVQPSLRRGKHPGRDTGKRVAQILRAIADELEGRALVLSRRPTPAGSVHCS